MSTRNKNRKQTEADIALEREMIPLKNLSQMRIQALSLRDPVSTKTYNSYEQRNALSLMEEKAAKVLDVIENGEDSHSVMVYINDMKAFYEQYIKPDRLLALKAQIYIDNVVEEINKNPVLANQLTINLATTARVSSKNLKKVGLSQYEKDVIANNNKLIEQNAKLLTQMEKNVLSIESIEKMKEIASETMELIKQNKEIKEEGLYLPDPGHGEEEDGEEEGEEEQEYNTEGEYNEQLSDLTIAIKEELNNIDKKYDNTPIKNREVLNELISDDSQEKLNKVFDAYEDAGVDDLTIGKLKEDIRERPGYLNRFINALFSSTNNRANDNNQSAENSADKFQSVEATPQSTANEGDFFVPTEQEQANPTNRKLDMNDNDNEDYNDYVRKPESIIVTTVKDDNTVTATVEALDDLKFADDTVEAPTKLTQFVDKMYESLKKRIEQEKAGTYKKEGVVRFNYEYDFNKKIEDFEEENDITKASKAEQIYFSKLKEDFGKYKEGVDDIVIPEKNSNVQLKTLKERFEAIKVTVGDLHSPEEKIQYTVFTGDKPTVYNVRPNAKIPVLTTTHNMKVFESEGHTHVSKNPKYNFTIGSVIAAVADNPYYRYKAQAFIEGKQTDAQYKAVIKDNVMEILKKFDNTIDRALRKQYKKELFDDYGIILFDGYDDDIGNEMEAVKATDEVYEEITKTKSESTAAQSRPTTEGKGYTLRGKGNTVTNINNTRFQSTAINLLVHIKELLEKNNNTEGANDVTRSIVNIQTQNATNNQILGFVLDMIRQYIMPISTYLITGSAYMTFFTYAVNNQNNIAGVLDSMTNLLATIGNGILNTGNFALNAASTNSQRNLNNANAELLREQANALRRETAAQSAPNNRPDDGPDNSGITPNGVVQVTERQLFTPARASNTQQTPQTIAQRVTARRATKESTKKGKAYVPASLPSNSEETLRQYGNEKIDAVYLQRRLINKTVNKIYNKILPYDDLYHLAAVVQIGDTYIVLEKVPYLSIKEVNGLDNAATIKRVNPPYEKDTLNVLLDR